MGLPLLLISTLDLTEELTVLHGWQRSSQLEFTFALADHERPLWELSRSQQRPHKLVIVIDLTETRKESLEWLGALLKCPTEPVALVLLTSPMPSSTTAARAEGLTSWALENHVATGRCVEIPERSRYERAQTLAASIACAVFRGVHLRQTPIKAIVLDCDDTLWRGAAGEQAPDALELSPQHSALQRTLTRYREAGIVLCGATNNDPFDVEEVFRCRKFPLARSDFSIMVSGFKPKVELVREVVERLGFAEEAILFIDDSWANLDSVRRDLPGIVCLNALDVLKHGADYLVEWLLELSPYDGSMARQRNNYYEMQALRGAISTTSRTALDFALSCGQRIEVREAYSGDLLRVSQLDRRATRFSSGTFPEAFQSNDQGGRQRTWIARVCDDYGDLGTVATMRWRLSANRATVETFRLSCRAFDRTIEYVLVCRLCQLSEVSEVEILFRETARNERFRQFLTTLGIPNLRDAETALQRFLIPSEELEGSRRAEVLAVGTSWGGHGDCEVPVPQLPVYEALPPARTLRARTAEALAGLLAGGGVLAPDNSLELESLTIAKLTELIGLEMGSILGVQAVGSDCDFFDLGGDSLSAMDLIQRIGQTLRLELPLTALFEVDMVPSALATWVADQRASAADSSSATRAENCE